MKSKYLLNKIIIPTIISLLFLFGLKGFTSYKKTEENIQRQVVEQIEGNIDSL